MDLALLTALAAAQPLIFLSPSASDETPFALAQICSAYSLSSSTITPADLSRSNLADEDTNVLIVTDLHRAHRNVQVEALELIRTKAKRKDLFVFVALLPVEVKSKGPPYLTPHLNDLFLLSHETEPTAAIAPDPLSKAAILELQHEVSRVRISAEMRRYTHDIVSFLRMHRACGGGVSAVATRQLYLLSKVLAVLNDLNYVTPSLVAMAARKVYLHRLTITKPEDDRTLQWGSDIEAVREALSGVTAESLVDEVLETVECPL